MSESTPKLSEIISESEAILSETNEYFGKYVSIRRLPVWMRSVESDFIGIGRIDHGAIKSDKLLRPLEHRRPISDEYDALSDSLQLAVAEYRHKSEQSLDRRSVAITHIDQYGWLGRISLSSAESLEERGRRLYRTGDIDYQIMAFMYDGEGRSEHIREIFTYDENGLSHFPNKYLAEQMKQQDHTVASIEENPQGRKLLINPFKRASHMLTALATQLEFEAESGRQ